MVCVERERFSFQWQTGIFPPHPIFCATSTTRRVHMRKYLSAAVTLTFLLFALGLMAQAPNSSGNYSNPSSGTNSSQNPNLPAGETPSSTTRPMGGDYQPSAGAATGSVASSQTGSTSGQAGSMSSSSQGQASVEGCIVREQTDYFIVPQSGTPVRLASTSVTTIAPHTGHRVKVDGTEMASNTGGGVSGTAGTSGAAAGGTAGSTGATGSAGAIGSSTGAGQSSTSGTSASSGQLHQAATQEITVAKLTMVSESCPANWNSSYPTSLLTTETRRHGGTRRKQVQNQEPQSPFSGFLRVTPCLRAEPALSEAEGWLIGFLRPQCNSGSIKNVRAMSCYIPS
jgi:hypothetical protein